MPERLLYTFGASSWGQWIIKLMAGLAALLMPIHNIMLVILVLICSDFFTGVWAAIQHRDKFEASKIKKTVAKFIFYNTAIILTFLVEKEITPELPMLKVVSGFIAMTELFSVLRNIKRILGLNIAKALFFWLSGRKEDWLKMLNERDEKKPRKNETDR